MTHTCHVCGHLLRDPVSIATGVGPSCAARPVEYAAIMFHARWSADILAGALLVVDGGGPLHVLGDAQHMLAIERVRCGPAMPAVVLVRDSYGLWVRMRHRNGVYGGAELPGHPDLAAALEAHGVSITGSARVMEAA